MNRISIFHNVGNHVRCELSAKMLACEVGDKAEDVETGPFHAAFIHLSVLSSGLAAKETMKSLNATKNPLRAHMRIK